MTRRSLSLSEVLDQFGRALSAAGLMPSKPDVISADGLLQRFHVEGDKRGSKNGWYILHADGMPAGQFGTWKESGASTTWRADVGRAWTEAEEAEHAQRVRAMREARETELAKVRKDAEIRSAEIWRSASARGVSDDHPYLARKQVRAFGIGQLREQLVVPLRKDRRLVGLQFIDPDGSKKFLTGTPKAGAYLAIGDPPEGEGIIAIGEGYATCATVHELTGWPVAVAFDAGNLGAVARAVRQSVPSSRLVMIADNDHRTGGNPGLSKARAAAETVSGLVLAPEFAAESEGTDWNDYMLERGREAAAEALRGGLRAASDIDSSEGAAPQGRAPEARKKGLNGAAHPRGLNGHAPSSSAEPRPFFEERGSGIYFHGVEVSKDGKAYATAPVFVCSPLRIEAVSRDIRGRNFGRLVSFTDADGHLKTTLIAARALGSTRGDDLRGALLADGLPLIGLGTAAQSLLVRYLMHEAPEARARMVTRTGWHGPAFVLPTQTFANEGAERYYLADEVSESSSYERAGTFERWRNHVSIPAGAHRRAVFALSCGFAGPLLELAGAESGGFHLVSGSTSGKTTALRLAGSVWGSADAYWRQWRSTDNGLEAIAEEFNDTLLALDEIGQADPKIIGEVAYMLANGRGKQRARKEGGARAVKTWRVLLLSTGEIGSADLLNTAGLKSRAGHDVRLVELPADAGQGFGIFDSAGGHETSRALSLALIESAQCDYGHAGPLFVERLAKERTRVAKEARAQVAEFVESAAPKGADGQVLRVAARFGLVCYAGELATQWDITGWDFESVRSGCIDAFNAWLRRRGTAGAKEPAAMVAQVREFIELHGGARFQDITPRDAGEMLTGHDHETRVINRAGFRKKDATGRTIYLVSVEVFRSEVCKGFEPLAVCVALVAAGVLAKQEGDRYTTKAMTPLSAKRLPFYALDGDALFREAQ